MSERGGGNTSRLGNWKLAFRSLLSSQNRSPGKLKESVEQGDRPKRQGHAEFTRYFPGLFICQGVWLHCHTSQHTGALRTKGRPLSQDLLLPKRKARKVLRLSLSEAPKASGMDPGTMEGSAPAYPLSDRKKISPEKKWTEGLTLGWSPKFPCKLVLLPFFSISYASIFMYLDTRVLNKVCRRARHSARIPYGQ